MVTPKKAYGSVQNSGVVVSDSNGNATLQVRKPQKYYVDKFMNKKILNPHIHYRVCESNLMLGPVETIKL